MKSDSVPRQSALVLEPSKKGAECEWHSLFATPLFIATHTGKLPHWHLEIKKMLYWLDRTSSEATRSAWMAQDFLSRNDLSVKKFKTYLEKRIRQRMSVLLSPIELELLRWSCRAWANVKDQGSYHLPHIHPHSEMSFIYFLSGTGSGSKVKEDLNRTHRGEVYQGALVLMDPRGSAPYMAPKFTEQLGRDAHVYVPPNEGTLLIFPSYLSHMVAPHNQKGPRASIAGNIFDLRFVRPSELKR